MEDHSVADIAPGGDVMLLLGPEPHHRARVSSVIMSSASKVFRALFSEKFKEGLELRSSSTLDLPLRDDDMWATTALCKILHLRNRALPSKPSPSQLLSLAMVADKYDCIEAVEPTIRMWLGARSSLRSFIQPSTDVLATAFIIKDSIFFRMEAKNLVLESIEKIDEPSDPHTSLPSSMIEGLESYRNSLRQQISDFVEHQVAWALDACGTSRTSPIDCPFPERFLVALLEKLSEANLWPIKDHREHSLDYILSQMKNMDGYDNDYLSELGCTCDAGKRCEDTHILTDGAYTFDNEASVIKRDINSGVYDPNREEQFLLQDDGEGVLDWLED